MSQTMKRDLAEHTAAQAVGVAAKASTSSDVVVQRANLLGVRRCGEDAHVLVIAFDRRPGDDCLRAAHDALRLLFS